MTALPDKVKKNPPRYFCTYFDRNYLIRGLTMFRSLVQTGIPFVLFVLAMDEETVRILCDLADPRLQTIPLPELESRYPELLEAKGNRSRIEYFFTLSPVLPLHILKTCLKVDIITYLDADLFFYDSPEPIFRELGDKSILVIEHRFPDNLKEKIVYGRFNVQYQSFRRDEQGLECLERWRRQCIDWCYDRLEGDRFADQKYLNEWPDLYDRLVVLQHKGAGVAPWNWNTNPFRIINGRAIVGGDPLVFYHFHGVRIVRSWLISHGLAGFNLMPGRLLRWLYSSYIKEMKNTQAWLADMGLGQLSLVDARAIPRCDKERSRVSVLWEVARKAAKQLMLVW